MIHNIITKLHSMGSLLDKNKPKKMWTEEKLNDVRTQLEENPKKLLHLLALQCGLAKSTAIVTVLLQLWPYKITAI
jgi:hypothetical protein